MLRHLLFTTSFVLLLAVSAVAQGIKPPATGVGILYNRETTFNLRLTTNRGIVPGIEFGRLRTYYKTTTWHVNFGELRHPKEQRQSADPRVNRSYRPWIFGKRNNFLVARAGWGAKRYYSEKARQKGVAVGISYSFGPSLGLLKPYYLAVKSQNPDDPLELRINTIRYNDENSGSFLDETKIVGAAPFSKGFAEVTPVIGGHATIAFHMDWGAFDEFVKALEMGLMIDAFPQSVPIMVNADQNSPLFLNFFLNLQLGKRR